MAVLKLAFRYFIEDLNTRLQIDNHNIVMA
jgi:hypothetical protein